MYIINYDTCYEGRVWCSVTEKPAARSELGDDERAAWCTASADIALNVHGISGAAGRVGQGAGETEIKGSRTGNSLAEDKSLWGSTEQGQHEGPGVR